MRRSICIILTFFLLIICLPTLAAETEGDFRGFHWKYEKNDLSITGTGDIPSDGPWSSYIDKAKTMHFSGTNLKVSIDLSKNKSLSNIYFEKGVIYGNINNPKSKSIKLYIGDNQYDFAQSHLTSKCISEIILDPEVDNYVIEDNLIFNKDKTILYGYFGKKKDIVIIPNTVKKICREALVGNEAKQIILHDGLEVIEDNAFISCQNLVSLTIPGSVEKIGSSLIEGCIKLSSYNFINPEVTKDFGSYPEYYFSLDSLNDLVIPKYPVVDNIQILESKHLNYLILSEGIEKIMDFNTYIYNGNLIAIYLPKSLTYIENPDNIPYRGIQLYVYAGSYAHKFAEENGFSYKFVNPISRIELSETSLELKVKKHAVLKATIHPQNTTCKHVTWFSSNEEVATVQDGKVTAVGIGECDIYCRGLDCGLKTSNCHIIVSK